MAIILDGTNGVTTPSVNSSSNLISTVVSSPTSLSLKTNGSTTAVTIDTSQNVLVGITSKPGSLGNSFAYVNQGLSVVNAGGTTPFFQTYNSLAGTDLKTWRIGNTDNTGSLAIQTVNDAYSSATERLRLNATGAVVLQGGNASASGVGIAFPATQSASSDANTLDDYEEGTWTPTIGGNATYNVQEGQYVKVGQLVYIFFDIAINVLGTGSTSTISGVPFTAANIPNVAAAYTLSFSYYANIATSVTWLSGYVPENATTISCSGNQTSASTIQVNGFAVFANGARISGSGVYRASA